MHFGGRPDPLRGAGRQVSPTTTATLSRPPPPPLPNVAFYRNQYPLPLPLGIRIDEFHRTRRGDYTMLEKAHSYIQWLFPLAVASNTVTTEHYALSAEEIAVFASDAAILRRVYASLELFLDFLGFEFRVGGSGAGGARSPAGVTAVAIGGSRSKASATASCGNGGGAVPFTLRPQAAQLFGPRHRDWISHPHNDKRISRMLRFLGIVGLHDVAAAVLRAFAEQIERSCAEERAIAARSSQQRRPPPLANVLLDVADAFLEHWLPCCVRDEGGDDLVAELFVRVTTAVEQRAPNAAEVREYLQKCGALAATSGVDDDSVAAEPRNKKGGASAPPSALDQAALRLPASDNNNGNNNNAPTSPRGTPCKDSRCPCDASPQRIGGLGTMPLQFAGHCCQSCKDGLRCGRRQHMFPPSAALQQQHANDGDDDDTNYSRPGAASAAAAAAASSAPATAVANRPSLSKDACNPDGTCTACHARPANPGKSWCSGCYIAFLEGSIASSTPLTYLQQQQEEQLRRDEERAILLSLQQQQQQAKDEQQRQQEEGRSARIDSGASAAAAAATAATTGAEQPQRDAKPEPSRNSDGGNKTPGGGRGAGADDEDAARLAALLPPLGPCYMCQSKTVLPGSQVCDNDSVAISMQLEAYADGWRQQSASRNGRVRFPVSSERGGLFCELAPDFVCILRDSPTALDPPSSNGAPGFAYTSAQALYHALQFAGAGGRKGEAVAESIRRAASPQAAAEIAQRNALDKRADWARVQDRILLEVFRLKFAHSLHARRVLLATGISELVAEGVSRSFDAFKVGPLLMVVRDEIKRLGAPAFGEPLPSNWLAPTTTTTTTTSAVAAGGGGGGLSQQGFQSRLIGGGASAASIARAPLPLPRR